MDTPDRLPDGTFAPGKSGNPGGRHKETAHVRALAREFTAEAVLTLVLIMREGTPDRARAAAAEALLDRAWGRPETTIAMDPDKPLGLMVDVQVASHLIQAVKDLKTMWRPSETALLQEPSED